MEGDKGLLRDFFRLRSDDKMTHIVKDIEEALRRDPLQLDNLHILAQNRHLKSLLSEFVKECEVAIRKAVMLPDSWKFGDEEVDFSKKSEVEVDEQGRPSIIQTALKQRDKQKKRSQ